MAKHIALRTDRLLLSALRATDIPQIVAYANNFKVAQYTKNIPHPYREKDAVFWLNLANTGKMSGTKFIWAIRNPDTEAFMGGIGLHVNGKHKHAELGYWIAEPFWGKGFITEAADAVIRFGFEQVGLERVAAHHLAVNGASGRVMEKNGMQYEGTLRQHMYRLGKLHDVRCYGILLEEFLARNGIAAT